MTYTDGYGSYTANVTALTVSGPDATITAKFTSSTTPYAQVGQSSTWTVHDMGEPGVGNDYFSVPNTPTSSGSFDEPTITAGNLQVQSKRVAATSWHTVGRVLPMFSQVHLSSARGSDPRPHLPWLHHARLGQCPGMTLDSRSPRLSACGADLGAYAEAIAEDFESWSGDSFDGSEDGEEARDPLVALDRVAGTGQ
jgi:hypothetical protein